MAKLILVRHGMSTWNVQDLWTGITDVPLHELGKNDARHAAKQVLKHQIDLAYLSELSRTEETFNILFEELPIKPKVIKSKSFNERDYGVYTGKNKFEIKSLVGEEKFFAVRRGWDEPIENGETLKDVYMRSVGYLNSEVLPNLRTGKNILCVLHGNTIRSLAKYLENISDEDIQYLEIGFSEVRVYDLDNEGKPQSVEVLT